MIVIITHVDMSDLQHEIPSANRNDRNDANIDREKWELNCDC
jgi:hypothetical protein